MPAIASSTPDLSQFPAWQTSGQGLAVAASPAPVPVPAVPPGLPIGAVLGVVTATGAYVLCDPTISPPDGSQVPAAVLASQATQTAQPTVYQGGTFTINRLFYAAGWSLPALEAALAAAGFLTAAAPSTTGFLR